MMEMTYKCVYLVARKPENAPSSKHNGTSDGVGGGGEGVNDVRGEGGDSVRGGGGEGVIGGGDDRNLSTNPWPDL